MAGRDHDLTVELPWQTNESIAEAIDEQIDSMDSIEAAMYIQHLPNRIVKAKTNLKNIRY